jgi:hypothetical protein
MAAMARIATRKPTIFSSKARPALFSITGTELGALQGWRLDRRYRRRHVCVYQHSGRTPASPTNGRGQHLDISMLESLVEWVSYPLYYAMDGAAPPPRTGASHATIYPYGPFPAGDGKIVMLGLQNEREWVAFCDKVLHRPELAAEERFSTNSKRSAAREELRQLIVDTFASLTVEQVVARLDEGTDCQRPGQHHARGLGASAIARTEPMARGRYARR